MTKWKSKDIITVSEHQSLKIGSDAHFEERHLNALVKFYGSGVPYFTLIHHGVKFNEYVGVLQVGNLTIEILPKMDKEEDNQSWREILVGMLRSVGLFDISAPSSALLSLKANSILDLYFELFLKEVEKLLHVGLVKIYRKSEENQTALKGSILFAQHISKNLVHRERFYVRHSVYDNQHVLNKILYKTIKVLERVNTNARLASQIGVTLLKFPEIPDIKVDSELFSRLTYSRGTDSYRRAIEIAKLILLHFHPDIKRGQEDVLALMFDMNTLWEEFVFQSLYRNKKKGQTVEAQCSKDFWRSEGGPKVRMRPDIVINRGQKDCLVLDTKWKNLNGLNPSPDDLRQMYTYSNYYSAHKTALVYPGKAEGIAKGTYFNPDGAIHSQECSVLSIAVRKEIRQWQKDIARRIL